MSAHHRDPHVAGCSGTCIVIPICFCRLGCITENYLCAPEANVYGIDFTRFKIRDMSTNATLFEISKPPGTQVKSLLARVAVRLECRKSGLT